MGVRRVRKIVEIRTEEWYERNEDSRPSDRPTESGIFDHVQGEQQGAKADEDIERDIETEDNIPQPVPEQGFQLVGRSCSRRVVDSELDDEHGRDESAGQNVGNCCKLS